MDNFKPELTGSTVQTLNTEVVINASASKIWNILTQPQNIRSWISDSDLEITIEPYIGGKLNVNGDLHGVSYQLKGNILQFDVERCFSYNCWNTLSELPDLPENYTYIIFTLQEQNENIILQLTQKGFVYETTFKHWNLYWNITMNLIKKISES